MKTYQFSKSKILKVPGIKNFKQLRKETYDIASARF